MQNLELKISDPQKHITKTFDARVESPEQKTKLVKAANDFETMLTSMMLKSMTKTTNGLFGEDNFGGDMLDSMFELELSSYMTKNRGLGVAELIYKNLTGEELDANELKELKFKKPDSIDSNNSIFMDPNKNEIDLHKTENNSIKPSQNSLNRLENYDEIIEQASEKYGVNKNLIKAIILAESAANPQVMSNAKAKGLMQLIDGTASSMGVNNVWDPKQNIYGGTKYISKMLEKFDGNVRLSLAAYNAGPGNVEKYNGIPPFSETKNYVTRVLGYFNHLESIS